MTTLAPPTPAPAREAHAKASGTSQERRAARRFLLGIPMGAVSTLALMTLVMALVSPPATYPEWKLRMYGMVDEDVDVVVLGSSRMQVFGGAAFDEYGMGRGWNLFIPQLTLDDSVALLRWMDREGRVPPVVILSLDDAELFRLRASALSSAPVREAVFDEPMPPRPLAHHVQRALDPEAWTDAAFAAYGAIFTDARVRSLYVEDGSLAYLPQKEPERATRRFLEEVQIPVFENATSHHVPRQIALLDDAAAIAERHDAHLVLLLPPSHPMAIDRLQDTVGWSLSRAALDERVPAWCATGHVSLYDLSDPRTFGDDGSSFRDGQHYGQETALAMARALREPDRDACARLAA